jgi:OmpA-OmpF porin, OOP family
MKKVLAVIAMSAAVAYSPFAFPQQGFIELGIGQSKIDIDDVPGASVDDKDTTWAISGGWMFHPMIGAEVGYRDLGEASATATGPAGTARATAEVDGFMLGALGRIPVGPQGLEIVPRVGLYIWDAKGTITLNGVPVDSLDDDGSDIYFGLGVQYAFTRQLHVGAHWARFDVDGDDIDVFELKIGFRF